MWTLRKTLEYAVFWAVIAVLFGIGWRFVLLGWELFRAPAGVS
jgi:hypothetical protein